jgi:hypothetical protein
MDTFLFPAFLLLVFVGIPIGCGLLIYFVPKKLGYLKTAKYLTIVYGFFILLVGLYAVFEDQLFTKNDAKELVEEQDIKLIDEFKFLKNESYSFGDYYHTFILIISDRDKQNAISKIKNSDNFNADNISIETLLYQKAPDRYIGKKVTQNYETENSYVHEYFEPSGREGYAPTFRRISISKSKNELTFEDIDE